MMITNTNHQPSQMLDDIFSKRGLTTWCTHLSKCGKLILIPLAARYVVEIGNHFGIFTSAAGKHVGLAAPVSHNIPFSLFGITLVGVNEGLRQSTHSS
jgi:hypothetical protein